MIASALLDALYPAFLLLTVVAIFWRGPTPRARPARVPAPPAPAPVLPAVDAEALAKGLAGGVARLAVEGWEVAVRRDPSTMSIRYDVEVPGASPFEVSAPTCDDVIDAFDGPSATVLFDGDLRVDGDPRRLAAQGGVLLALRDLVRRPGVVSVRLAGGVLLVQEGPSPRVDLDVVVGTVQQAVVVARGCERRVLEVRVRGALVQGLAWTGGAAARCPYCHDGLEGELATCEACRTIHHTDCLADAGGCTLLGCRGRRAPA
jgi:hypothetical protein